MSEARLIENFELNWIFSKKKMNFFLFLLIGMIKRFFLSESLKRNLETLITCLFRKLNFYFFLCNLLSNAFCDLTKAVHEIFFIYSCSAYKIQYLKRKKSIIIFSKMVKFFPNWNLICRKKGKIRSKRTT